MMRNIFERKEGRLQKIIVLIMLSLVLLVPLGIYAADNATSEEQPLEEVDNTVGL